MASRSAPRISNVRTTPFTCGAQASVTIRTRSWRSICGKAGGAAKAPSGVTSTSGGKGACEFVLCIGDEAWRSLGCGRGPVENLQISGGIFREGGAAFNPVAVVEVETSIDPPDRRVMNMTAHDTAEPACSRFLNHGILETADIFDRILHLLLQVRGQRPVGQAPRFADCGADLVQFKRARVGPVAQEGQPARIGDHAIELVAMQDEQSSPVRGFVNCLADQFNAGDLASAIVAEHL